MSWEKFTVLDALPTHPREVASVSDKTTVEDTLKLLNKHNILGALVFTTQDPPQLHGMVDVLDILQLLLSLKEKNSSHTAFQQQKQFNTTTIKHAVDLSGRDPCVPVQTTAPIITVLRLFATGVHRVPVVDPGCDKVTNMLSQSDLLNFINSHPDLLASIEDKTVEELKLGSVEQHDQAIVKISHKAPALDAFKFIIEHKLSAVAVVGDDGRIMAQVSASDLRALTGEIEAPLNVMSLLLPTYEFVARVRKFRNLGQDYLVWCQPGSKFKTIIPLMLEQRLHRLLIIDNYVNLLGVVALTDIAKCVLKTIDPPAAAAAQP